MLDSVEENLMKWIVVEILRKCASCREVNKISCPKCQLAHRLCYHAVKSHIPKDNICIGMQHLTSPDVQEAKEKIQKYLDELDTNRRRGINILIYSGKQLEISESGSHLRTGTGKTSLGCIILKKVIRNKVLSKQEVDNSTYFCTITEIINDLKKPHMQHIIETTEFLMIDSVGEFRVTESTDQAQHAITDVLQTRLRKGLPTIITTPLNRDAFLEAYGDELSSLLFKNALFVDCSGEDYVKAHIMPKMNPGELDQ